MTLLSFLGNTFLLTCCGSSASNATVNATQSNLTLPLISEIGNASYSGNNRINYERDNQTNTASWGEQSPTIKPSKFELYINITFPKKEEKSEVAERMASEVVNSNRTIGSGNNFVQINIINNGAPISNPTVLLQGSEKDVLSGPEVAAKISSLPWWKTSVVYQIYPRSFFDKTGSGTGDLKGIVSKADYLKDLGIGAIWISPIYVSPMADFGYDVADFKDIDPIFGNMADFHNLLQEMHKRDIKVIMDFVPNHSSNTHEWFVKSVKNIQPYSDYYVWEKPSGFMNITGLPIPPNNWLSVFGKSAWEWNEERQEFYLHQFLKEQPDLNVRNPAVMTELDNILRFWLNKGVDGFRIDALKHLFEAEDIYQDEPIDETSTAKSSDEYYYLNHTVTVNQPETVEAIRRWRKIFDEYTERLIVTETYDDDIYQIVKYYSGNDPKGDLAHFPFNFNFITDLRNRSDVTGINLRDLIEAWLTNMPEGEWPNWVLGNHDNGRIASRLGKDLVDSLNMMALLLPGTPTTYYGEEIGMEDTFVTYEQAKDPSGLNFGPDRYAEFGRDPSRTPLQWDSSTNAGFSSANTTWLPVNPNYQTVNVDYQMKATQSHLKVYRSLTRLRKTKTFQEGSLSYPIITEEILSFLRSFEGEPSYLVVINTSIEEINLDASVAKEVIPTSGEIVLRSSTDNRQETAVGSKIVLTGLNLIGGEGIVIKF